MNPEKPVVKEFLAHPQKSVKINDSDTMKVMIQQMQEQQKGSPRASPKGGKNVSLPALDIDKEKKKLATIKGEDKVDLKSGNKRIKRTRTLFHKRKKPPKKKVVIEPVSPRTRLRRVSIEEAMVQAEYELLFGSLPEQKFKKDATVDDLEEIFAGDLSVQVLREEQKLALRWLLIQPEKYAATLYFEQKLKREKTLQDLVKRVIKGEETIAFRETAYQELQDIGTTAKDRQRREYPIRYMSDNQFLKELHYHLDENNQDTLKKRRERLEKNHATAFQILSKIGKEYKKYLANVYGEEWIDPDDSDTEIGDSLIESLGKVLDKKLNLKPFIPNPEQALEISKSEKFLKEKGRIAIQKLIRDDTFNDLQEVIEKTTQHYESKISANNYLSDYGKMAKDCMNELQDDIDNLIVNAEDYNISDAESSIC